jgi:hypothetical protein
MKISEILESLIKPRRITDPPLDQPYDLAALQADAEKSETDPNAGWYVSGREDPQDPFMYNLQTRLPTSLKFDGKYAWINAIEPYVDSNPYLPRYYTIRLQPDSEGKSRVEYQLEKLVPLESMTTRILQGIGARTFNDENYYTDYNKRSDTRTAITRDLRFLFQTIRDYDRSDKLNFDPKLMQALRLVNEVLKQKPFFSLEINKWNVMVRLPNQLVITDPIGDSGMSVIKSPTTK